MLEAPSLPVVDAAPLERDDAPVIESPLYDALIALRHRLVVIGSVARGVRWPKDLDLLYDYDSRTAEQEIRDTVRAHGLKFRSVSSGFWTFDDYGWMVEILGIHAGRCYRGVRARAQKQRIAGLELWVARPEDAPPAESTTDNGLARAVASERHAANESLRGRDHSCTHH